MELLRNLAILIGIGIVLFALYPNVMSQMIEVYSSLFGPIAILFIIIAALPRRKKGGR